MVDDYTKEFMEACESEVGWGNVPMGIRLRVLSAVVYHLLERVDILEENVKAIISSGDTLEAMVVKLKEKTK
jgi:hypothetical protein